MRKCFLLFLFAFFSIHAMSQPGTLDSSFGGGGFVAVKIQGSTETHLEQSVVQPDGKIVAVGWAAIPFNNSINQDIVVARFNTDGTPDASFGSNGIVTTDFDNKSDFAYSVVIQNDGKIVIGGRTQELDGSSSSVVLVRYKENGEPDPDFGNKGKIITPLTKDSEIKKVLIQKSGKIIAVGFTQDFLLIRYNTDGTLDSSFGKNGIVLTDFGSSYDIAVSAAIQGDDKILVAGNIGTFIGLARYRDNGALDKSFGERGKIITKLGKDVLQLTDIAIQDQNKIIACGTVYKLSTALQSFDFFLARYTAKGALDNSFGTNGMVFTEFGPNNDEAITSVAIQNNDKILVGGGVSPNNNSKTANYALARYHFNGSLDVSFGAPGIAGLVKTNFGLPTEGKFYNYINSVSVSNNRLYCIGMNKLSNDNGNLSSTQGIIAAYLLDNKNLSCTPNKTVSTEKGISSAIVSDIGPVLTPGFGNSRIKYSLTGATAENGRGSVSGKAFNIGVTSVTYKMANDPLQSCSFLVTVEDREKPVITNVSASPSVRWTSDNKTQTIKIGYWLKDNSGWATASLSVKSNEGNETDWEVLDLHHVRLKLKSPGQIFTITITASDKSGNKSSKEIDVAVANETQ